MRNLLANGELKHIRMGSSYLLPRTAIQEFVERKMHYPLNRGKK
ncbi:excisionase family DNA-binding protein [Brucellaceae bacterium D45D]